MERWLAKINNLKSWQAAILIAVVGSIVFFTGLKNPFIGDDQLQIVSSVPVHSITNLPLFFEGSTFYSGEPHAPLRGIYYRPLMITVYSFVYTLFGPHTFYFHLLQLMFVIGSAIMLYLVFERLFNPLLAIVLALVFLVHPISSQVAFAIPTLQDAMFFFFGILAFWILIRFESIKSLWLVITCLFLSLLSKEAGVLFVVMSLAYLIWSNRERLWPFVGVMVMPGIAYLILKIHAVGLAAHSNPAPVDRLSLIGRLLTVPSIMLFYLSKFIFPFKLSSGYYWAYPNFSVRHVLLPLVIDIAVIAFIVYLAWMLRKKVSKEQHAAFIFFALWSAIGLALYLQIFPIDFTASETWFYFPMAGMLGMLGVLLIAFQSYIRAEWFLVVTALVICVLGIRTAVRGTEWSSAESLYTHDIATSKEDYVAYFALAQAVGKQGDFTQAKAYSQHSVAIFPTYTNYNELGNDLANLGDYAGAQSAYLSALKYSSVYSTALENLGELALVYGNPAANKQNILYALRILPQDFDLWVYLAILEDKSGDNADAKAAIVQAAKYGQVPSSIYDSILNDRPFAVNLLNISARVTVH
jgi:tetratricopeptide (TPR) repeat protein